MLLMKEEEHQLAFPHTLHLAGCNMCVLSTLQSHDARVMAAWDSQQAAWQQQARHLAAVAHKDPEQLALLTGTQGFRLNCDGHLAVKTQMGTPQQLTCCAGNEASIIGSVCHSCRPLLLLACLLAPACTTIRGQLVMISGTSKSCCQRLR